MQPNLFDIPAQITPVDPHLRREEKPRLSYQSTKIVERLEEGPAFNAELVQIAIRYSARIHDINRAWEKGGDKRRIVIRSRDYASGLVEYGISGAATA